MALLEEARQWLTDNELEGFLHIADATPHKAPEQAAATIELSEIMEGTIQALRGLQAAGL